MQALLSAVRLDFGSTLPNNPFLSIAAMTLTFQNPFPGGSADDWASTLDGISPPENLHDYGMDIFMEEATAYLAVEYTCRFLNPLPWGEFPCNPSCASADGVVRAAKPRLA